MIYMIRAGESGPVKIGLADDPRARLTELQVGSPERLNLIRMFEGDVNAERELHVMFDDLWIRGEWFSFSKRMLGDLGLPIIFRFEDRVPRPIKIENEGTLAEYLEKTGIRLTDFAAMLGVGVSLAHDWKSGRRFPRGRMLVEIERATNGSVKASSFMQAAE